jgi:hypothetical protein
VTRLLLRKPFASYSLEAWLRNSYARVSSTPLRVDYWRRLYLEVRRADRIGVLHGGRLAECGSHAELMRRPSGLYAKLVKTQLA